MNYTPDLETRMSTDAEFVCSTVVNDVAYITNATGIITIDMHVNNAEHRALVQHAKREGKILVHHINSPTLKKYDRVDIYKKEYSESIDVFWLVQHSGLFDDTYAVRFDEHPSTCPCCGSFTVLDELGLHCINSRCAAKVYRSLMLYCECFYSEIIMSDYLLQILRRLLLNDIISGIPDLYEVTVEQIDQLQIPREDAIEFVELIQSRRGHISFEKYLTSLNIEYWAYLEDYPQSRSDSSNTARIPLLREDSGAFPDVASFWDWMKNIVDSESSPRPYMNERMFYLVYRFFSCLENRKDLYRLEELGVFRK